METKFREISELMDDSNDKMSEGTYLALYNKLKELRDESKKDYEMEDRRGYYSEMCEYLGRDEAVAAAKMLRENHELELEAIHFFEVSSRLDKRIKELEEDAKRRATHNTMRQCKCGSTTHFNPNALKCRLNKRVLRGELGNVARDRALAETAALADPPTEV